MEGVGRRVGAGEHARGEDGKAGPFELGAVGALRREGEAELAVPGTFERAVDAGFGGGELGAAAFGEAVEADAAVLHALEPAVGGEAGDGGADDAGSNGEAGEEVDQGRERDLAAAGGDGV